MGTAGIRPGRGSPDDFVPAAAGRALPMTGKFDAIVISAAPSPTRHTTTTESSLIAYSETAHAPSTTASMPMLFTSIRPSAASA